MVGVTGIEPAPSWSQTKRLTIRQHPENIQFFLNYGQTCGQAEFFSAARSQFPRVSAVFRLFARLFRNRSRKRLHAPKPSALPLGNTPKYSVFSDFGQNCVNSANFQCISNYGQTCGQSEFLSTLELRFSHSLDVFHRFVRF